MLPNKIQQNIVAWINMYSGLYDDLNILSDYPALMAISESEMSPTQLALWISINSKVVDFAQNPVRPIPPFISVHLQLLQKQGATPYKSTQENISQLATFSGVFSSGHSINFAINGVTIPVINFHTDNATTYSDIKAALLLAFPDATITIDSSALTVQIYQIGMQFTMLCSVSGTPARMVVITAPYSKVDTTIKYIDKAFLYLQSFGQDSDTFMQNLEQSLLTEDVQYLLQQGGITFLSDTGIKDIHTLLDSTMEERFSYDLVFAVLQEFIEVTPDIKTVPDIASTVNN